MLHWTVLGFSRVTDAMKNAIETQCEGLVAVDGWSRRAARSFASPRRGILRRDRSRDTFDNLAILPQPPNAFNKAAPLGDPIPVHASQPGPAG